MKIKKYRILLHNACGADSDHRMFWSDTQLSDNVFELSEIRPATEVVCSAGAADRAALAAAANKVKRTAACGIACERERLPACPHVRLPARPPTHPVCTKAKQTPAQCWCSLPISKPTVRFPGVPAAAHGGIWHGPRLRHATRHRAQQVRGCLATNANADTSSTDEGCVCWSLDPQCWHLAPEAWRTENAAASISSPQPHMRRR